MDAAERERVKSKNTGNLEAYDYYLRADDIRFDWDKATNHEARRLLEKAIELDPGYARAYSAFAWTHVNDWRWGWADDPDASKKFKEGDRCHSEYLGLHKTLSRVEISSGCSIEVR